MVKAVPVKKCEASDEEIYDPE
ncbi:MAG: hypothetical protein K5886_07105 [Lachnospiraceae bacterium]|nr:hypothetical protein [Lachnospiraceae bacterium]